MIKLIMENSFLLDGKNELQYFNTLSPEEQEQYLRHFWQFRSPEKEIIFAERSFGLRETSSKDVALVILYLGYPYNVEVDREKQLVTYYYPPNRGFSEELRIIFESNAPESLRLTKESKKVLKKYLDFYAITPLGMERMKELGLYKEQK